MQFLQVPFVIIVYFIRFVGSFSGFKDPCVYVCFTCTYLLYSSLLVLKFAFCTFNIHSMYSETIQHKAVGSAGNPLEWCYQAKHIPVQHSCGQ